jgi:hypothetical protein
VLQLLGFVVDFVPFHAENFGEHAFDQMMTVEQPIGDVAAGGSERKLAVAPVRIRASRFSA